MKKTISILLVLFLCVFLAACEKAPQTTEPNGTEQGTQNTSQEPGTTEVTPSGTDQNQPNRKNDLLPLTYNVPLEDIYVDVPDYHELEEGLTQLFLAEGQRYVAFTAHWNAEAPNAQEAHYVCYDKFASNMDNYEGGINSLDITSEETLTINGIEMYRFEGTINYGSNERHDGYAIGYAIILNGIPCEIIGSVIGEQSEEEINLVRELVEAMANTVRTEP